MFNNLLWVMLVLLACMIVFVVVLAFAPMIMGDAQWIYENCHSSAYVYCFVYEGSLVGRFVQPGETLVHILFGGV